MALLEFSITPLGAGESVSQYVARAVDLIDKSGLDYRLHAMGTVVEGDVGPLLDLLQAVHRSRGGRLRPRLGLGQARLSQGPRRRARRQSGQRRKTPGPRGEEVKLLARQLVPGRRARGLARN